MNALRRDLHIALFQAGETQQDTGFKNRQQIFDVHDQFLGQPEQIFAAAAIVQ